MVLHTFKSKERQGNVFLEDEKEWFKKETTFFEKLLPILSHHLFVKFLIVVFILVFAFKFLAIFTTIVFSLITSYIKFKRQKLGITIEIEPSYLFSIILAIAFGIKYGLFYIFIPVLLPAITMGVSGGLVVNILNKLIVLSGVYIVWTYTSIDIILVAVALVIITDVLGLFLRIKLRQAPHEILLVITTNALIRFTYFILFLGYIAGFLFR